MFSAAQVQDEIEVAYRITDEAAEDTAAAPELWVPILHPDIPPGRYEISTRGRVRWVGKEKVLKFIWRATSRHPYLSLAHGASGALVISVGALFEQTFGRHLDDGDVTANPYGRTRAHAEPERWRLGCPAGWLVSEAELAKLYAGQRYEDADPTFRRGIFARPRPVPIQFRPKSPPEYRKEDGD